MSLRDQIRALRLYYQSMSTIRAAFAGGVRPWLFPFTGSGEFTTRHSGEVVEIPRRYWTMLPSAARLVLMGAQPSWDGNMLRVSYKDAQIVGPPTDKSLASTLREVYLDDVYHLRQQDLRGKLVLDVGAYVGDSTVAFALRGARVHAFEPLPALRPYLEKNIALNGLKEQVTVHPVGLSAKAETITLEVATCGFAGSTVLDPTETGNKGERLSQTLKLVDGAAYLRELSLGPVYLLKLDCEGCEYGLFQNPLFWKSVRPEFITLEYHRGGGILRDILVDQGYQVDPFPGGEVGYMFARLRHENSRHQA